MWRYYFVLFEQINPNKNYAEFTEKLKELGRPLGSLGWVIKSTLPADLLCGGLHRLMGADDKIIVAQIGSDVDMRNFPVDIHTW